jgi:hypothetical protein
VAAFAAYGCCSLFWASDILAGVMFGQALLYFAVAAALARRADWAGWFAVGIATSGLAVDGVFLTAWPGDPMMIVDTAMQAGLLWLALQSRALVGTADSSHRLTSTAAPPIGWTFALAAGVLPPAVMGAFMPSWHGSCLSVHASWEGSGELLALALVAVGGLHLVARLRTTGLLALALAAAIASSTMMETALEVWSLHRSMTWLTGPAESLALFPSHSYSAALQPGHHMAILAFGFALAALVPLGPQFVRALFSRKTCLRPPTA